MSFTVAESEEPVLTGVLVRDLTRHPDRPPRGTIVEEGEHGVLVVEWGDGQRTLLHTSTEGRIWERVTED